VLVVRVVRARRRSEDRRRRVDGGGGDRSADRGADRAPRDGGMVRHPRGQLRGRNESRLMETTVGRAFSLGRGSVIRYLDLISLGATLGLALMGLLAVYTATVDPDVGGLLRAPGTLFNRQIVFCFMAGGVLVASILFDYRVFKIYAGVMYL